MHYTPLYITTDGTLLSSLITVDKLIEFAKKNNIKSLTITDNNMYNVIDFYEKCIKNNIKPIIGLNLLFKEKELVLYAKNYNGYKNLIKLSTLIKENNINDEILKKYSSDLILIIPFNNREMEKELYYFETIFISYSNIEEKDKLNDNLIFMKKTRCLNEKDNIYLEYLDLIKEGKVFVQKRNIKDNIILNSDLYSKNNYLIYDLCNVEIKKSKNLLPIYTCPNNMDSYTYLKKLCVDSIKNKFEDKVPKVYVDRLKYELEIINKMNFCNYFLVVWDYVKFAKENDIYVGPGRGSAAGSLVSYLLNITEIDPLKYNLFFERFLNPERITMPDIDIDFEDQRRDEVINYCIQKYGIKKVAPIITFGTLKSKQAIRDVARTMDIDLQIVDFICKKIDANKTLIQNYNENTLLKKYINENNELKNMYQIALKLEGIKRHTSIHAAGIVMSNEDLDEVIPLDKSDDNYITGYSMEYLESLGLLKMDFLALTTLSTIHNIVNDIKEKENIDIDFNNVSINDSKTLEIFTKVDTTGIFQFESEGMKNFLRKFKPNSFEEIVSSIALYRPGPMENIDSYIERKRNTSKINYLHNDLVSILKPTYGIIIYQEQIMQIASIMAGYSYGEADVLRRAMSKKKESVLLNEKEKFINQSIKRGYEKEIATKVYDLILKFASYGFNKAHSVAYSLIAYRLAYLKAYYPAYFMKNLLNSVIGNSEKTKEYIYESKNSKLMILKPDVKYSFDVYSIENKSIRVPLTAIKNIGINAVKMIIEEREKKEFKDIYDFVARLYSKTISKKVLESLILSGSLDSFGYYKKTLIDSIDILINYAEIAKDLQEEFVLKPELLNTTEYSKKELMEKEFELFGFYLSNHPVTEYINKYNNNVKLKDINLFFDKHINTIIYVSKIKEILTKNNDKMCFITGSDEITNVDIVIFPKIYGEINIKVGDIFIINGKVEKRFDKYQIIVNKLKKLN